MRPVYILRCCETCRENFQYLAPAASATVSSPPAKLDPISPVWRLYARRGRGHVQLRYTPTTRKAGPLRRV